MTQNVLVGEAQVLSARELGPGLRRVKLGGAGLTGFSSKEGFDTRFKLVLPGPTGLLPQLGEVPEDWYRSWQSMPAAQRAVMRTYTIRQVLPEPLRVVVDMVVHGSDAGPGALWAAAASPGDVVHVVGPHEDHAYAGREFFAPPGAELLLVADETAVPAVAGILRDCDRGFNGQVFLEVAHPDGLDDVPVPPGITVTWLPRRTRPVGAAAVDAVRELLGLRPLPDHTSLPPLDSSLEVEVWETDRYSSAGEDLAPVASGSTDLSDHYVWVAGESAMVKALRRSFVTEAGLPRDRGAFMGYWRRGVAMRS